jgi:predicted nucleic acid-binding protein
MDEPRFVYWDACVFISLLNSDPVRADVAKEILQQFETEKNGQVVTSATSKVEVAYVASERANRVLDESIIERMDQWWEASPIIQVVEFHDDVALLARDLIRRAILDKWQLKPIDAIHLATAQWIDAKEFHTYDGRLLEKGERLVSFAVREPHVLQNRLPNF